MGTLFGHHTVEAGKGGREVLSEEVAPEEVAALHLWGEDVDHFPAVGSQCVGGPSYRLEGVGVDRSAGKVGGGGNPARKVGTVERHIDCSGVAGVAADGCPQHGLEVNHRPGHRSGHSHELTS